MCPCADGIAADPKTGTLWIANGFRDNVQVISERSVRVLATIHLPYGSYPSGMVADPNTGVVWVADVGGHVSRSHMVFTLNYRDRTVSYYRYSAPRFTTASHASFVAGSFGRFAVRTQGFPKAAMTLRGHLPAGLHATTSLGTLVIKGTPFSSDRLGTYRVEVTADNGIGTPRDSYVFVQHLVIRLR